MFIQSEQGMLYLSYCYHRYYPLGGQVFNTFLRGKLSVNSSCPEQLSISKGGVGSFPQPFSLCDTSPFSIVQPTRLPLSLCNVTWVLWTAWSFPGSVVYSSRQDIDQVTGVCYTLRAYRAHRNSHPMSLKAMSSQQQLDPSLHPS